MPVRSFRITIKNNSSLTMNLTFQHLCGGAWTEGNWTPPKTIAPGGNGGMQAESDGVLTGTEGYVKYDLVNGSAKQGMLYVYRNNPYMSFSGTHWKYQTDTSDVLPDCDYFLVASNARSLPQSGPPRLVPCP